MTDLPGKAVDVIDIELTMTIEVFPENYIVVAYTEREIN
jgi:hypothetical protein